MAMVEKNRYDNPFRIREWWCHMLCRWDSWIVHGLGQEQKVFGIVRPMLNVDGNFLVRDEMEITAAEFEAAFGRFAREVLLPQISDMLGQRMEFGQVFHSKMCFGLNVNQTVYVTFLMLRFMEMTCFYNAVPSARVGISVNLKKEKYAVYLDSHKVTACDLKENIIGILYALLQKEVRQYESLDTEGKVRHLLKKLGMYCDFTKKAYSYQIRTHHLVISRHCDLKEFIRLLETRDSDVLQEYLENFTAAALSERLNGPAALLTPEARFLVQPGYANGPCVWLVATKETARAPWEDGLKLGVGYAWLFESKLRRFCEYVGDYNTNETSLVDTSLTQFLALLRPAEYQVLLAKLRSLEGVREKRNADNRTLQADFSEKSMRQKGLVTRLLWNTAQGIIDREWKGQLPKVKQDSRFWGRTLVSLGGFCCYEKGGVVRGIQGIYGDKLNL